MARELFVASPSFRQPRSSWLRPALALCFVAGLGCSDGDAGAGGPSGSGGTPSGGGTTATGGSTATGGVSGQGGSSATGGRTGTGGSSATGGRTGTGGSSATGGRTGTGGGSATGGRTGTGGSIATGGVSAAGGTAGTGTTSTGGGAATGGVTGSGGVASTGGAGGAGSGGQRADGAVTGGAAGGQGGAAPSDGGTDATTGTGGSTGGKSAGCGKTITRQDAKSQKTLSVGGTNRYYLIYTPTSYDPETPLPMVFILHGMDMNNWWAANDSSGFKMIEASANKAILVYPQGSGDAPGTTSKWGGISSNWNDGATGNDMKFIDALVALMEESYCVDTSRIFATGFSMGGMMTESLACARSKVFRAFAPVAGWGPGGFGGMQNPSCSDASVTVPVMITQGSSDGTVTPAMGQASRDFWIKRNTCTTTTTKVTVPSGEASCVAYQGCKEGTAVNYCSHGGGHMVPGNAGGYIWSFFSSFN